MNRDHIPIVLLVMVVLAMVGWSVWHAPAPSKPANAASLASLARAPAPSGSGNAPGRESFSTAETRQFLASAMAAEAMADPLQRCLAYPDPPGSHWSRAAVEAYCRYRTQPFLGADEAKALIAHGHADELDRRLADALHRQQTEPASLGLLDHIYLNDFDNGSPELRTNLDEWKRQSPQSAFAFAASGMAYVDAAGDARGSDWISKTPAAKIAEMERLLALARADLKTAIRLDATVTPTYQSLVDAARMNGDDEDSDEAARAGLKATPYDYALFAQLMASAQPKWGGSMDAMRDVAATAQARAKFNPLLELVLVEPDAYAYGICGCGGDTPATHVAYTRVLDRIAATSTLSEAGNHASDTGQVAFGLVYLSEALRFKPEMLGDRMKRIEILTGLRLRPDLRDVAESALGAEADRALAQAPTDSWMLAQLGQAYVDLARWDQAWTISEQLIRTHPGEANSWVLRAQIQQRQPRSGLHDTDTYIIAHFANDPDARGAVEQARMDLASEGSKR